MLSDMRVMNPNLIVYGTLPLHDSDCAVHNGPALPLGACNCSARERIWHDKANHPEHYMACTAAARWLMEDDTGYENEPEAARRAAAGMLRAFWDEWTRVTS